MRLDSIVQGLLSLFILASCGGPSMPEDVKLAYEKLPENIDFNQHVKPILSDKCYLCHGPDEAKISGGLQLHSPETAFSELPNSPGKYGIFPGNAGKSESIARILSDDPELVMPVPESYLTLSAYEKAMLIKWIEDGAEYKDHWAFLQPENTAPPKVAQTGKTENPIDNFVLVKLAVEGLEPNEKADRETLLRRLSFDLTGLPPTLEELNSFMNDDSPNAYEKQVDRLLASEHYGEQMTLRWMDLARYADTHGYSVDRYRDMSPWRDWVIKSFNENMPYDQFVTWQLAGDLMENPTREMKLATAFNRIHPQNMEGGIVNEEFLVEYAVDRTSTFSEAFLGLTVACARCHDHKYDPISQKNFYELTSYFNNINESGQISWNDAMPVPTMLLTSEEEDKMMAYIDGIIKDTEANIEKIETQVADTEFEVWLNENKYASLPTSSPKDKLIAHYKLENKHLGNALNSGQKGTMKREYTEGQKVVSADGKKGDGILLDGDTWLDLKQVGVFGRNDAFSIGLWAKIPADITDGNIFHKGDGAILNNWRGYHLRIVEDKLELMMAHTAPDNAITEISKKTIPKDKWIHLSITYDGSSMASGYKLFVNGEEWDTEVISDNLYKDILFRREKEPGLQLGARLRGKGIKGSIIDEIKIFGKELSGLEVQQLAEKDGLTSLLDKPSAKLTSVEKSLLKDYYHSVVSSKADKEYQRLAKLRKAYVDSVEKIQEVMVMKEMPEPVQAFVLDRGVYDARTDSVFPNTPEAVLPMPENFEKNRLGLAKWLFHDENPLTARVAANRFWQYFFGKGIVKTSEDFGNQGEMPSHPALLDWLALEFKNSGWDMKALQKRIVMSSTYQQSSKASEKQMEMDKENRLLARGPAKRLTGEMLRDNALVASGLLQRQIGGESVKPYQPEGLWKVNGMAYQEDTGDKLYRRSMYTVWKRSVPHPTLATFDAPDRAICTSRRQETNTPLQALVLLNDPTYIEAARVLGKQMMDADDLEKGIGKVFKKLTGRSIRNDELQILKGLQKDEYIDFTKNPSKMEGWLNTGEFRISKNEDRALIAANAIVASTIMNSDATITKR
ncbi:DUF1553 domain-containing protein [Maribacter sp. 2210JD10-5]|uniref:DUF1553 domain-containing protein n=1 Tax=Maribacter sp. 2210JD10-5 TaxID=3386272 RepID=UPI0039BD6863